MSNSWKSCGQPSLGQVAPVIKRASDILGDEEFQRTALQKDNILKKRKNILVHFQRNSRTYTFQI